MRTYDTRGVTMQYQQEDRLGQQVGEYRLVDKLGGAALEPFT